MINHFKLDSKLSRTRYHSKWLNAGLKDNINDSKSRKIWYFVVTVYVRPGTHYHHVTWAHVSSLRVRLGYFNFEFWRRLTLLSTLLMSRDLAWSSGRLMCQHASQIAVVAHISWDVTYTCRVLFGHCYQLFPEMEEMLTEYCANGPFYMTPSNKIVELNIREPTHGKE
jgi:hypothetical protein